jgi:hypothetical protein
VEGSKFNYFHSHIVIFIYYEYNIEQATYIKSEQGRFDYSTRGSASYNHSSVDPFTYMHTIYEYTTLLRLEIRAEIEPAIPPPDVSRPKRATQLRPQ